MWACWSHLGSASPVLCEIQPKKKRIFVNNCTWTSSSGQWNPVLVIPTRVQSFCRSNGPPERTQTKFRLSSATQLRIICYFVMSRVNHLSRLYARVDRPSKQRKSPHLAPSNWLERPTCLRTTALSTNRGVEFFPWLVYSDQLGPYRRQLHPPNPERRRRWQAIWPVEWIWTAQLVWTA